MSKQKIDAKHHIVVLLGEGSLVEREAQLWINKLLPNGKNASNFVSFDASEDNLEAIVNEAQTVSMFATKKTILLRGLDRITGSFFKDIISFVKNGNPSVTLLITGTGWPSKGIIKKELDAFKRALKKSGYSYTFTKKSFQPVRFVQELAAELGISIHYQAIQQLARDCGSPSILENEIHKLACFADEDTEITTKDVSLLCEITAEAEIWGLTGAIVKNNINDALASLHRLLKDEVSPHQIFGMVAWQIRQLTVLQDHLDKRHPIGKYWQRSRDRDAAISMLRAHPLQANIVLPKLLAANRAFNSSKAGAEEHIHWLILSLCGAI